MTSWQGTDSNERRIHSVHNALVDIYLWGVQGVSPDYGYAHKIVSPEVADRHIARARQIYVELVEQKAPPSARAWKDRKIKELDGLIARAAAVREGRPQKMDAAGYEAYRRSLGLSRGNAHSTRAGRT